uniref:Uncharacterized protein n=1 Tax=Anguilla anguilla TaxID=7936 RepID=A0A0E9VN80_ANGAN
MEERANVGKSGSKNKTHLLCSNCSAVGSDRDDATRVPNSV